mgnify:CR=1 FL=1
MRIRETDVGMVRVEVQLLPDEAARVMRACEISAETADRVDGLVALAEAALRGEAPGRPPVEIMVHVDAATLAGNLDDGHGISAETSRRLLCDAGIVPILDDKDGKPLDVGRKTRTIPPAIRRALAARDQGCRFPGCPNRRFVEAYHVLPWADGGETKLANMALLCTRHHVLLHEGGFQVAMEEDDRLVFRNQHGAQIPALGLPNWFDDGVAVLRQTLQGARGTTLGPSPIPAWDGTPVDYARAAECLLPAE